MKRLLLSIGMMLLLVSSGFGQTYEPGDIAIVRYNTDADDGFSFVALVAIANGDSIFFTDEGWDDTAGSTGWRVSTEEHLKYISPGLSAGDVVHIEETSSDAFTVSGSGGTVTLRRGSSFSLGSGDQILAYDGFSGLRPASPIFLAAIHGDDGATTTTGSNDPTTKWTRDGEVAGVQHSTIPNDLINGVTAVSVFGDAVSEVDNMIYDCSTTSSTKAGLLIAINNRANWTTSDATNQPSSSVCSFTVSSDPSVAISGNEGWRLLSFPITGGIVTDVSDDSPVQGVTGGSNTSDAANFYINTASDGTSGNGYATPTNVTTAWGDGLGFAMYFYNNATAGSSALPIALDASGSEPGSNVAVTLSGTYTLVGNPFTSNIELDGILGNDGGAGVSDGLVSPISIWNDATSSFDTYNIGEGAEISSWQGFFLQRNSASTTSLSIPTTAKTDSAADISSFSKAAQSWRQVSLSLEGEGYTDNSSKLYFTSISHEGRDGYDGAKLNALNNSPNIAFVQGFSEETELLVQDARATNPGEVQEYTLTLNDMGVSGEFTISWPTWKNIPANWTFVLTDNETDTEVNMRDQASYTFTVESKEKRSNSSVLNPPSVKAKTTGDAPRFGITLQPNTAVSNEPGETPLSFGLEQNYPNPFNPSTTINYSIAKSGQVSLSVYNLMGQKVAELVNEVKGEGSYNVSWNAAGAASGMYYYRLEAAGQTLTRKMTLIK